MFHNAETNSLFLSERMKRLLQLETMSNDLNEGL